MANGQTATAVNDWQDVSDTNDWQDVSDTPTDLTKGTGGIYPMYGYLNPTDKQPGVHQIPYSNVPAAMGRLSFNQPGQTGPSAAQAQYEKDKAAEGKEPSFWGSLWDKTQKALEAKPDETVQTKYGPLRQKADFLSNEDKAIVRTLLNVPGWISDTAQKWWMTTGSRGGDVNEFLNQIDPGALPGGLAQQFREDYKRDPQMAMQNLSGTLVGLGATGLATHAAPKVLAKGAEYIPGREGFRSTVRESLGVPENTEKVVQGFGKESTGVREGNLRADETTLLKRGVVDEKNANEKLKFAADVNKVTQDNLQDFNKWDAERKQVEKDNTAINNQLTERSQSEARLEDASQELESRYESAEKSAKAADDAAWKEWRKKIGNQETETGGIRSVIEDQKKSMDPEDVGEFRKILKESKPEQGEDLESVREELSQVSFGRSYDRLTDTEKKALNDDLAGQGLDLDEKAKPKPVNGLRLHVWKTQLEYAVRKATRGNVRYAIGQVLDKVRDAENELSVKAGADAELKRARELHGPFMDAFRNSPNEPATAASRGFERTTPKYARRQQTAELVSRAAKYDPKIQELTTEINQLNGKLKDLPSAKTLKGKIKNPPPMPVPKPLPTEAADLKTHQYGEPEGNKPLPDAPDVQLENRRFIDKQLRKYGRVGAWVARLVIGSATAGITHGDVSHLASNLFLGEVGLKVLTRVLRSESVLDWLSRASEEDRRMIESLSPPDAARLRAALGVLAKEEMSRNPGTKPKIAPWIGAWMAGQAQGTQPQPQP